MKINSSKLQSSFNTLSQSILLPRTSARSPACPTPGVQGHRGTAPAQAAAFSRALCCKETVNNPHSCPSRLISKSKKKAFCITHVAKHLRTSPAARASHAAQGGRPPDWSPITWPALYPWPMCAAWLRMLSGHRSARGDKGQLGIGQRSRVPSMGDCRRNPSEGHRHVLPTRYLLAPLDYSHPGKPEDLQASLLCS